MKSHRILSNQVGTEWGASPLRASFHTNERYCAGFWEREAVNSPTQL